MMLDMNKHTQRTTYSTILDSNILLETYQGTNASIPFSCARPDPGSVETDREVLLHLYKTTGGESWWKKDGWAENATDLGSWYGVTTNAEGRVVKLELKKKTREGGNGLVGENVYCRFGFKTNVNTGLLVSKTGVGAVRSTRQMPTATLVPRTYMGGTVMRPLDETSATVGHSNMDVQTRLHTEFASPFRPCTWH